MDRIIQSCRDMSGCGTTSQVKKKKSQLLIITTVSSFKFAERRTASREVWVEVYYQTNTGKLWLCNLAAMQ